MIVIPINCWFWTSASTVIRTLLEDCYSASLSRSSAYSAVTIVISWLPLLLDIHYWQSRVFSVGIYNLTPPDAWIATNHSNVRFNSLKLDLRLQVRWVFFPLVLALKFVTNALIVHISFDRQSTKVQNSIVGFAWTISTCWRIWPALTPILGFLISVVRLLSV